MKYADCWDFFCLVGEKWAFHYGGGQVVTFAEVLIFFFFCPLQTERTVVHGGNQMEITTAFKLVEMVNVPRLMAIDVLFSRRRLRIEWLTSVTSCVGRRRGDKTQREERRAPGPFAGVDGRFDVNLPTANNLLPISSWHRS